MSASAGLRGPSAPTRILERAGLAVLRRTDPERAHGLALAALRAGLGPRTGPLTSPRLAVEVAGLSLPNPLGIAAGFDKDGVAMAALSRAGPGFVELGAVTPRPQPGNPRPRLFRLAEDGAAINRFGFNNAGMEAMAARLARRPADAVIGLNLGANKDSDDRAADYCAVLARCGPFLDFATVNVSSPNTERLRDLQGPEALAALLARVLETRAALPRPVPLFVKIAPDLSDAELAGLARVAIDSGIDGIIATNTTLARDGLRSPLAEEAGGLSGAPLRARAEAVLARLRAETGGALPLIGVGGIATAEDACARLRAGASALQLYTALGVHGLTRVADILIGLDRLLARDGLTAATARQG